MATKSIQGKRIAFLATDGGIPRSLQTAAIAPSMLIGCGGSSG